MCQTPKSEKVGDLGPNKGKAIPLPLWGGWGTEPVSNFYAGNRCLEVLGVSSWGCTAKTPLTPLPGGHIKPTPVFFQIKGPKWALGPI